MKFQPNQIYHIYNQGNNKEAIFYSHENYIFFLKKMRNHLLPHVDILCYCLMPNHFHILAHINQVEVLINPSKKRTLYFSIGLMLRSYSQAINKQENRTGTLFRQKTKAKNGLIEELITIDSKYKDLLFRPDNDYAKICFDYIHQNPVKAGLVNKAEDWVYSSAKDYVGLRKGTLCNQKLAKELLDL